MDDGRMPKILRPIDVVGSNPRRYWGVDCPGHEDVNAAIVAQLVAEECESIVVYELFGWQIVEFNKECYSEQAIGLNELRGLFMNAKGFEKEGGLALRHEAFLFVLAAEVVIWVDGISSELKGVMEGEAGKLMERKSSGKVCICYRLAQRA